MDRAPANPAAVAVRLSTEVFDCGRGWAHRTVAGANGFDGGSVGGREKVAKPIVSHDSRPWGMNLRGGGGGTGPNGSGSASPRRLLRVARRGSGKSSLNDPAASPSQLKLFEAQGLRVLSRADDLGSPLLFPLSARLSPAFGGAQFAGTVPRTAAAAARHSADRNGPAQSTARRSRAL